MGNQAAALCLGVMTGLYLLYQAEKYRKPAHKPRELALKGGATLAAALMAAYGYGMQPTPGRLFLLLGLSVCVIADVVLDLHFLAGTVAFGLGHLCYGTGCILTSPPAWGSLVLFAVLAGALLILYPRLKALANGGSTLPYLAYGLVLCAMLALALPQQRVLFLGASLFVVSDGMLAWRIVRQIPSKGYDYACLGVYYLAQYLIALSTLL